MRFHLARAARPRLLIAMTVVGWVLWVGFRPGGTEVGPGFGLWGTGRLYALTTPIALVALVPLLATVWSQRRLTYAWHLVGASPLRRGRDQLANFASGYLVFAGLMLACTVFAVARMQHEGRPWLPTLLVILTVGPLAGGYITLAVAYIVAAIARLDVLRIVTVAFLAGLDAVNQLPLVALSLSGTSDSVNRAGYWSAPLRGEMTTIQPDPDFTLVRLALVAVTSLAVFAVAAATRPGQADRSHDTT
jgi:hypothetical protein